MFLLSTLVLILFIWTFDLHYLPQIFLGLLGWLFIDVLFGLGAETREEQAKEYEPPEYVKVPTFLLNEFIHTLAKLLPNREKTGRQVRKPREIGGKLPLTLRKRPLPRFKND